MPRKEDAGLEAAERVVCVVAVGPWPIALARRLHPDVEFCERAACGFGERRAEAVLLGVVPVVLATPAPTQAGGTNAPTKAGDTPVPNQTTAAPTTAAGTTKAPTTTVPTTMALKAGYGAASATVSGAAAIAACAWALAQ